MAERGGQGESSQSPAQRRLGGARIEPQMLTAPADDCNAPGVTSPFYRSSAYRAEQSRWQRFSRRRRRPPPD